MRNQTFNSIGLGATQGQISPNDHELRRHAEQLLRNEEENLKEKLEREKKKQGKIQEIEQNFIQWAKKKSQNFQEKQMKVEKKKEEEIARIVKRCQERDKYVGKKHQDYKITRKKKMNIAWKQAGKFNEEILTYCQNKHFLSKTLKSGASGTSLHAGPEPEQDHSSPLNANEKTAMNQSLVFMNTSKVHNSANNQSTFFSMTQHEEAPGKGDNRLAQLPDQQQNEEQCRVKFSQALEKLRRTQKKHQEEQIQHLGNKYNKIEQSRSRRRQLHSTKKNHTDSEPDRINTYGQERSMNHHVTTKKVVKNHHQSSETWKREPRVRDRTEETKQRRQEMLDRHLTAGDEYLENLRIKHLKTVLAKSIAYNAMEKKLYLERLNS